MIAAIILFGNLILAGQAYAMIHPHPDWEPTDVTSHPESVEPGPESYRSQSKAEFSN